MSPRLFPTIALAISALQISACSTPREDIQIQQCPQPPSALMAPPWLLDRLDESKAMTQPEQIAQWLRDTKRYREENDRLSKLQGWLMVHCLQ